MNPAGAGPVADIGSLASFGDAEGEHAYYIGYYIPDVYHLDWNGGYWSNPNLTGLTGGPFAAANLAIAGFSDAAGEHVYYRAVNGDIHQLYLTSPSGGEVDRDISAWAGAPYSYYIGLTAYNDSLGEHVIYVGLNQHVYELVYNGQEGSVRDFV